MKSTKFTKLLETREGEDHTDDLKLLLELMREFVKIDTLARNQPPSRTIDTDRLMPRLSEVTTLYVDQWKRYRDKWGEEAAAIAHQSCRALLKCA